jgi:short-subunit dehydrogenase involved in D-alanine esterification of teichoic acids
MNTTGNTILITGGASGIGLALTKKFVSLHNKVIITGRDQAKLDHLKQAFPGVCTFTCDLTSSQETAQLVQYIHDQHTHLNILINNASVQYNYEFTKEPELDTKISYEFQANLIAPVKLIGSLLPVLLKQPQAAIVNVSSGLGLVPKRSAPVYCASKAGIHIFSKALRYQLENTTVKVFEVIPPLVDTPMTAGRGKNKISASQLADEFIQHFSKNRYEINIGKTKLLRHLQRIWPAFADRILKNN